VRSWVQSIFSDGEDSNSALQSESSSLHSVDVSLSRVGASLLINSLTLSLTHTHTRSKKRQTDTDHEGIRMHNWMQSRWKATSNCRCVEGYRQFWCRGAEIRRTHPIEREREGGRESGGQRREGERSRHTRINILSYSVSQVKRRDMLQSCLSLALARSFSLSCMTCICACIMPPCLPPSLPPSLSVYVGAGAQRMN